MILCVCPNLCYDRIVVVRGFRVGEVHRAETAMSLPSGKGLNVARAAAALGAPVVVTGFVALESARKIISEARAAGLSLDAVRVDGPTRVCTLIIDPGQSETVVNEAGAAVKSSAIRALRRRVGRHLHDAPMVIVTGSLPPGLPPEFPAWVLRRAGQRPTILDTPGEAFRLGLASHPSVAKLNRKELGETLGRPLPGMSDIVAAAQEVRAAGARSVAVSVGEDGVVVASSEGVWLLRSPAVERVSTIGAGDSLTAGIAAGTVQGRSLLESVRLGVAAAASDVTTLLPGTVDLANMAGVYERVGMERLS